MDKIKFIFFEGCPNAQEMKTTLQDLGYELEEVEQNGLPDEDQYKDFSSPTIIKNGKVIFGQKAAGGGCSMNIPSRERLKELLT